MTIIKLETCSPDTAVESPWSKRHSLSHVSKYKTSVHLPVQGNILQKKRANNMP